jgi:hypothetical protein
MGATMRTDGARIASARSASRFAIRATFTPGRRAHLELRHHGPGGRADDLPFDLEGGELLDQDLAEAVEMAAIPGLVPGRSRGQERGGGEVRGRRIARVG